MARYLVGFDHKTHLYARLIMWFTKSQFSHSYIVQEGSQGKYVLEATWRGVNLQWYETWKNNGPLGIVEFVVDQDQEVLDNAWDKICTNRLNRPYSWLQILGDAIVIIAYDIFKVSLPNPFGQRKADVCSELVLAWLRRAGLQGFEEFRADTVTPEDLIGVIRNSDQFSLLEG